MGDDDRFLKLLLRYQTDIKAFIGSLVLDPHVRDDVFQEVAITLLRKFDAYDAQYSFGAWARGVAAKKILQHRAQAARFPALLSLEAIQAVLDAFDRTEETASSRAEALKDCVQRLPEHSRSLLSLRYQQGLKPAEIARQSGRTLDAVYQILSRVRAKLEDCVRQRLALEVEDA